MRQCWLSAPCMPFGSHKSYKAPCQDKSALTVIGPMPCQRKFRRPGPADRNSKAPARPAPRGSPASAPYGRSCHATRTAVPGWSRPRPPASGDGPAEGAPQPAADALQPPLRCVATREREGRTPSTLARTSMAVPENRPLRPPGAPTQTCGGVIQGAQLWGQRSTSEKPHLASALGRMQRMNTCAGPRTARHAVAAKEAARQCQKAWGRAELAEHRCRCARCPPGSRSHPPASVACRLSTG